MTDPDADQIRQIAQEIYERRLALNREGDAQNDWRTAERLAQSPWRRVLFESHGLLIRFRRSATRGIQFAFWDIPRWFLFTLPSLEWMKLLAVPLVLGTAGSIITSQIQREANQNAVLKEYFDQLQTLTFDHNLLAESPDTGAIVLARGRTVAALRELDLKRKEQLIAFLQASGLSRWEEGGETPVISFANQNLSRLDLRGIDLSQMDFEGAILQETRFQRADLQGVNFQGADLRAANLQRADLFFAKLQRADLLDANLQLAVLVLASLQGAELQDANLQEADLWGADLQGAKLQDTNFQEAILSGADFQGADLLGTDLRRAKLQDADFQGSVLLGADLQGAILQDADLQGAVLLATNLNKVQELVVEQLEGTGSPFLCGVNLSFGISSIDPNRDCDQLPQILANRYFGLSLEAITESVEDARKKQWN